MCKCSLIYMFLVVIAVQSIAMLYLYWEQARMALNILHAQRSVDTILDMVEYVDDANDVLVHVENLHESHNLDIVDDMVVVGDDPFKQD